ncbi:MAG TPA: Cys-tRNA(Pro) deacylase [Spirochaetota bacterium]
MGKEKTPVTSAVRALKAAGVSYTDHLYDYEEKGGTAVSSRELGVDEHAVIKTLVMQDDRMRPLIILMHGDYEVSTKELARTIGARSVGPCSPDVAEKHSGYRVGGTSPFGTRTKIPLYMEETIMTIPKIYINGGKRGYLVGIDPHDLVRVLSPKLVHVGISK